MSNYSENQSKFCKKTKQFSDHNFFSIVGALVFECYTIRLFYDCSLSDLKIKDYKRKHVDRLENRR